MSPTSEFMAEVSLAHSYPELFRVTGPLPSIVLLVLWCFVFVVTESSTGPIKRFKEMTVAHVGVHSSGFPGSLLSGTLSSYGASTVGLRT